MLSQRRMIEMGAVAALVITAGACARDSGATENHGRASVASDTSSSAPLATIGGERVTLGDLRGRIGEQLDQLDIAYRRARDKLIVSALDSTVRERLFAAEAQKRGKTVEQLVTAELPGGSATPTEVEIAAWYKDNEARLNGRPLDQLRGQIADLLQKQRQDEALQKLEQRLRDEQKVTTTYEPMRLQFANDGSPALGAKDAPVTLVEFSDFQCPYCRAAAPVLKEIESKFGNKVRVVYRQFPISSLHPFALKAAEASLCANDQCNFWEMHDAMFSDQSKLAVTDLKQTARRLGMDGKKFDGCVDSGHFVEHVQNDQREGQRVGVNGTPAMFINGRYVEGGSVPYSVIEALIQKELARTKS
jgi:protein-disulfide isomerase